MNAYSEKEFFKKLENKKYVTDEVDEVYSFEPRCGQPTKVREAGIFTPELLKEFLQRRIGQFRGQKDPSAKLIGMRTSADILRSHQLSGGVLEF